MLLLSRWGFRPQRVGFALVVAVGGLHPLLFALLFPNSVAELLHAVQLRVVEERQEVSVPHPVFGRVTRASSGPGKSREDVGQPLSGNDLEAEAQQGLDEAVLNGVAVVHARVGLSQAADQQPLVSAQNPIVQLDLKQKKNKPIRKENKSIEQVWVSKRKSLC